MHDRKGLSCLICHDDVPAILVNQNRRESGWRWWWRRRLASAERLVVDEQGGNCENYCHQDRT